MSVCVMLYQNLMMIYFFGMDLVILK